MLGTYEVDRRSCQGRLPGKIRDRYSGLIDQITQTVRELPPNGRQQAVQMVEGQMVATRTKATSDTPFRTLETVEGRFGRIKPRYRMRRELETESGAINFIVVVCNVLT